MKRKEFIISLGWLTAGVLTSKLLPASEVFNKQKKIKGRVLSSGKGIKNVVVSDGYSVVLTNGDGKYEIEPNEAATAVFVSTPSGYEFKNSNGISRHYILMSDIKTKKNNDFELTALNKNDDEHEFIIWADPQVKNDKDVKRMMGESVPDVQRYVQTAAAGTLIHGITVGDIVWDAQQYFPAYDKAVQQMGIPFFQCLGNHDMDYNKGGDEASDDTFQQTYGPTYYSFNRGQAHYVVMDNVRYLGKDRDYDGFVQQNQLDWLQKDLSYVSKDKLIILCLHIPVHSGTKNNTDLYALLEGRNVHIMSGHTHYHKNVIRNGIFEHNHGTVCGAWWTGNICEDGTPNGYGMYKVKGTELKWHYQATGQQKDYQMHSFVSDNNDKKLLQVNIWNYDPEWKTEYWVDGQHAGSLMQFDGMDPMAYKNLIGPDLPKSRGFAEPKLTNHLFKADIPANTKEIKIVATDRFGNAFTKIHTV